MAIVGMSFIKIVAEKKNPIKGKVGISNNVGIKKVEKADLALGTAKQEGLRFEYEFKSKYDPEIGEILIIGDVLLLESPETVKQVMDSWKKDKKVPGAMMKSLLNNILTKCNIQALILSRDLNLPPPIPMPKVDVKENPKPSK
ncbi:hypothetical protein JW968_03085 [Candidatus Woesearchaeota archaeon]|nr:hypothetical protein [Candidatus Woesearchaeota archaeon]